MEQFPRQNIDSEIPANKPLEDADISTKKKEVEKGGKISSFIKRQLGLAATVGLGYIGGMHESVASGQDTMTKASISPEQSAESIQDDSSERDGNSFEVLHKDHAFIWGVEYVPKKHDGKNILAERFVKIDTKTNETSIIGEYNNLIEAAEGLSKITDLPESILRSARANLDAIQTEKDFQASGLVEPNNDISGKTHVETRTFKGYGIETKNKVEVDEKGMIVDLQSSESSTHQQYQ
jgi:hypothetical protein